MHPFGGTQICPRCSKAVYAAEQVMGPGRKLYHKPCLACAMCNKRLDSFTLLEHDQKPYCKSCHVKNFGTRDLHRGNIPHREEMTPSESPQAPFFVRPTVGLATAPGAPFIPSEDDHRSGAAAPGFTYSRSYITGLASPESANVSFESDERTQDDADDLDEQRDLIDLSSSHAFFASRPLFLKPAYSGPTNTGRPGYGGIPRTVPLSPTRSNSEVSQRSHPYPSSSVGTILNTPHPMAGNITHTSETLVGNESGDTENLVEAMAIRALVQTSAGTKFGAASGREVGVHMTGSGSPRKWGMGTPRCPRCDKNVYFAEQVKAVGKTYHKGCLRCTECNMLLDSSRLRDHDGEPICVRCYGKLHGPQGSGYALLGKAGG